MRFGGDFRRLSERDAAIEESEAKAPLFPNPKAIHSLRGICLPVVLLFLGVQ